MSGATKLATTFVAIMLIVAVAFLATRLFDSQPPLEESSIPQVFVFPSGREQRLISEEQIPQNNCDGSAETSQTIEREHKVVYTMELGNGITVDLDGTARIPEIGEVSVGTEVALNYQVGYGREDSVRRSVVVATKEGTNIQHTVRQFEVWERGEVLIVVAGKDVRLPYSFRRDFSIESLPPANVGCLQRPSGSLQPQQNPNPAATDIPPTIAPSVTAIKTTIAYVDIPVNSEAGAVWNAPETGIFSFRIASGAYNGWRTDEECASAVPDRPGCWRSRLNAYIGCEITWQRPAHSPEMSEPMAPDFSLGDFTYLASMEAAEEFAVGLLAKDVQLNEGDCIRFVVIDGYNPNTGFSAYTDNRGDTNLNNAMRIQIMKP